MLSIPDLLILVGYFCLVSWIGLRVARNQKNADTYFVTKKKIPGWIMGLSLFAATLSSFTFIGFPGWTYRHDMQIIVREYMSIVGMAVASIFVIPIYRSVVKMSVHEYLEYRYGYFARAYTSVGIVLITPVGIGVLLYVLCLALHGLTGISLPALILVIGLVTVVYTVWGGIEGCIYTEAINGAMFIGAGLLTLGYLLFFATEGGPREILQVASAGQKFKVAETDFDLTRPTLWLFIWVGFFHFINNYSGSPHVVQRYLVAPTYASAVKGSWLNVGCCLVTWFTFMSIGTLLWAFYQIHPERLAGIKEIDSVFPYFMGSELPVGLAGLILAGLLASGIAGISSGINSTSACIQSDFYDRWAKGASPQRRLNFSKRCVFVLGAIGIGIALLLTLWEGGIVQFSADIIMATLGPVFGSGHLTVFFLGIFTRRTSKRGMYVGLVTAAAFALWAIFTNPLGPVGRYTSPHLDFLPGFHLHPWFLFGLANLTAFVTAYVASLILDPGKLAPKELTIFGREKSLRSEPVVPHPAGP